MSILQTISHQPAFPAQFLTFCFNRRTLKALVHLPALQHLPPRAWLRAHGKKNSELLRQIQDFSKSRHARKRVGKCNPCTHTHKNKKTNMEEFKGKPEVSFAAEQQAGFRAFQCYLCRCLFNWSHMALSYTPEDILSASCSNYFLSAWLFGKIFGWPANIWKVAFTCTPSAPD